jgi:MtrB/PioB family decaheme-associated outer membrane protein
MRFHSITTACVLAGALTWGVPATGQAQATQTSGTISGAAEVGARTFTTEPTAVDKGKFEEYRVLPAGALLERAWLTYTPADSFGTYRLTTRRLGQLDQSLWLQASRPGLYDFNIRWDKTPHLYTSTARSPGDEGATALGFNTLPTPRPDSTAWKNAPYIGNVRSVWDPIKASLALTPSDALDFNADFLHIGKKGGLPKSVTFNATSGPTREYVSPIDETVNNFRVSQSYTSGARSNGSPLANILKSYQGTVSYEYSHYNNALSSVMVDNPLLSAASVTGTLQGTNTARVSLAPSNSAQTLDLVGSVMLPFRTRITGSMDVSDQTQNDAFLPEFNNSALATAANVGLTANVRPSLDGKVRLTTVNLTATSHPISNLTLAAKYRNHSYSNQTPQDTVHALVVSDRSITTGDQLTEWDPYTLVNSDVSAAYQVVRGGSVAVGYAVEDMNRSPDVTGVVATREKTPRYSADYRGISWLDLHASYSLGQRRGDGQYTLTSTEIDGFRRYYVADRDRSRTNVMATVTPVDQVSVGLSYQIGDDQYPNSLYGLQSDKSTTTGVDIDWSPMKRLSMAVGYSQENVDAVALYRYRTGSVGSVTYNNPSYNWTTTNSDRNTSVFANVTAALIPDKLDATASYSVIDTKFHEYNVNAATPTGGTAAQNLSATVENWPEVAQKLTPIALAFKYKVNADWAFTLRYNSEDYTNVNFQAQAPLFTTTTLAGGPAATTWTGDLPGSVGSTTGSNTGQYHFLGANYHPYTARWLTFTVSWHPSSLPLEAGRSTF